MSVDPLAVAGLVKAIYDRVQNVKVYQRRCRNLTLRCNLLISALMEDNPQVTPSVAHADALTEAHTTLYSIRDKVKQWARLNTMQSLLKQGDIREGVNELHRKIDTCIDVYHVKISQELARAQTEQTIVAQRDNAEIQEKFRDFMEAFTRYLDNQNSLSHNATFQAVVHDIRESAFIEENGDPQSSIHRSDVFDDKMREFCKSLVTLELSQPAEVLAPAKPVRRNTRRVYIQPPARTSSVFSLVPNWRSSLTPQLPPLDLGEEIIIWQTDQFVPLEPSSLRSDRSSLSSEPTSLFSRGSISTRRSQRTSIINAASQSERSSILTVSRASQPLSPLDVALTTYQQIHVLHGQPPLIKKATMEGLIQFLLQKSAEEDTQQYDTFFIGHLSVISPIKVFRKLIRRYDNALNHPEGEVRHDIVCRIMRLIKDWLNNDHVIVAEDVLNEMRSLALGINDLLVVNDSNPLDKLVLEVVRGIREKASMNFPPPPITSSFDPATHRGPPPSQLAYALARLEGERYQRILPIEYIAHGRHPLYCPNLLAAIHLNQTINNWVQSSILDLEFDGAPDELRKRSEIKRYFVQTAKACHKIRNFSSSNAIMGALQSENIACLTLTHDCMAPAERRDFKKLADFFKPDFSYRTYRKALPKDNLNGCIPWHVVHLHDIDAIIGDEKDVDEHDPPLINFEKWAHLKDQAMSASRYRDVPFEFEENGLRLALEYLKKALQRVGAEVDSQVLRENSTKLKRNEDALQGVRPVGAVGAMGP